jgi:hypothetical protein
VRRNKTLAIALLIPAIVWGCTSWLEFNRSFQPAAATILSTLVIVIFVIIEKVVIASPAGITSAIFRFTIALCLATIASSLATLQIFETDIQKRIRIENVETEESIVGDPELQRLKQNEDAKCAMVSMLTESLKQELDTPVGGRPRGLGPVAKLKQQQLSLAQKNCDEAGQALTAARGAADSRAEQRKTTVSEAKSLIQRFTSLWHLICTELVVAISALVIAMTLLALDLLVLTLKMTWADGYEVVEKREELDLIINSRYESLK